MDRNLDTVQVVVIVVVALRKESVDRNEIRITPIDSVSNVALRKESVDRNLVGGINRAVDIVALRKESVDRNILLITLLIMSMSRSPQGERG